jgi:hypothetical protein
VSWRRVAGIALWPWCRAEFRGVGRAPTDDDGAPIWRAKPRLGEGSSPDLESVARAATRMVRLLHQRPPCDVAKALHYTISSEIVFPRITFFSSTRKSRSNHTLGHLGLGPLHTGDGDGAAAMPAARRRG